MRLALAEADIDAGEIGYINAHGSSTPLNDPTETGAIRQVFGDHAATVPISGTKGYYGHALGRERRHRGGHLRPGEPAPLAAAHRQPRRPDPACDLDYLAGRGPAGRARVPPQQLLRLRRHQRLPGVPPRRRTLSRAGRFPVPRGNGSAHLAVPLSLLWRICMSLARRALAESLGTFGFVFLGCASTVANVFPDGPVRDLSGSPWRTAPHSASSSPRRWASPAGTSIRR